MLEVDDPLGLQAYIGRELGVSDWVTVDQEMIDAFARTTGDDQWIHVDVERAAREAPGGKTIAHGYLLLSLFPRLNRQIYRIKSRARSLNYGMNKVRFTNTVPVGSRVRLRQKVKAVEPMKGGHQVSFEATLEIEGQDRPAVLAEPLTLVFG